MALMKCPECGKEISSLAKSCPNCGCPIASSNAVSGSVEQQNMEAALVVSAKHLHPQNRSQKFIVALVAIIIGILVIVFLFVVPNLKESDYNQALSLLESGDYIEGQELLMKLKNYKDADQVLEKTHFETYVYAAIDAFRMNLKNPNSLVVYDVSFYPTKPTGKNYSGITAQIPETFDASTVDELHPIIIVHYGAQNGFGGMSTGYLISTYHSDVEAYTVWGTTETTDINELDENDNHYLEKLITTVAMKMVEEEVQAIGSVDIERINRVLKNSSFSVVKIVP